MDATATYPHFNPAEAARLLDMARETHAYILDELKREGFTGDMPAAALVQIVEPECLVVGCDIPWRSVAQSTNTVRLADVATLQYVSCEILVRIVTLTGEVLVKL